MTKTEWRVKYSAFRRIYRGVFTKNCSIADPVFKLAVECAWRFAKKQHPEMHTVYHNRAARTHVYKIISGVRRYEIQTNTYS